MSTGDSSYDEKKVSKILFVNSVFGFCVFCFTIVFVLYDVYNFFKWFKSLSLMIYSMKTIENVKYFIIFCSLIIEKVKVNNEHHLRTPYKFFELVRNLSLHCVNICYYMC